MNKQNRKRFTDTQNNTVVARGMGEGGDEQKKGRGLKDIKFQLQNK